MISRDDKQRRLDSLLSGIEDELFRIDDHTVLSEDEDMFADIEHVRALIQSQIGAHLSNNLPHSESNLEKLSSKSQSKRLEFVPMTIPEEADGRRRLLEAIIANQPNVLRQAQVAFSANEKPTDSDVDDMVTELIRLGIFKKSDKDN